MSYAFEHTVSYHYSCPVFLEPHSLRFQPRTDPRQRVLDWQLQIVPEPTVRADLVEAEGGVATRVWFSGMVRQLTVRAACNVEIIPSNPFAFIPDHPRIPVHYEPAVAAMLTPCLHRRFTDPAIDHITGEVLAQTQNETMSFLTTLCQRICHDIAYVHRPDGTAYNPTETLARRSGACRDLVVLYVACCRAAGLAARFVSGYTTQPDDDGRRHLHAWAEVYVPGGGWRGFDPTHGLAVVDDHIAVTASADPELTAVVSGTFRGSATARIVTDIRFVDDADTQPRD